MFYLYDWYKYKLQSRLSFPTFFEINNSDFTQEEDKSIYDLSMQYGPRWTKIASFFRNRTPVQIKSRYRNVIQKNISIN